MILRNDRPQRPARARRSVLCIPAGNGRALARAAAARAIVDAFAELQNAGRGVLQVNGKMVERLHLEQAQGLLARAGPVGTHKTGKD